MLALWLGWFASDLWVLSSSPVGCWINTGWGWLNLSSFWGQQNVYWCRGTASVAQLCPSKMIAAMCKKTHSNISDAQEADVAVTNHVIPCWHEELPFSRSWWPDKSLRQWNVEVSFWIQHVFLLILHFYALNRSDLFVSTRHGFHRSRLLSTKTFDDIIFTCTKHPVPWLMV